MHGWIRGMMDRIWVSSGSLGPCQEGGGEYRMGMAWMGLWGFMGGTIMGVTGGYGECHWVIT